MVLGMQVVRASGRRVSGPAQRAGRSDGMRGGAAQASRPHPLEYQMYYAI
jgi:hypothetical protein